MAHAFAKERFRRGGGLRRIARAATVFVLSWACWDGGTTLRAAEEDPEAWLRRGKDLYEAGKYEQAVAVFREAFERFPAHMRINFHYGLSAVAAQDYEAASMAFDRVLILNPDLPRVRLELARSYFHLGLDAIARQSFEDVLATEPPAAVRARIESYLGDICRRQRRHAISGRLRLSLTSDSNAALSASEDEVFMPWPDTFLVIPGDAVRDQYLAAAVQVCHSWRGEREGFAWDSCATGYGAWYDDRSDLDIRYANLETGPSLRLGSRGARLHLRATAGTMEKGQDAYQETFGMLARHLRPLSAQSWFASRFSVEDRTYFDAPANDSVNLRFEIGPTTNRGPHQLGGTVLLERNDAEGGENAYWMLGAGASYRYAVTPRTSLRGRLQFEYSEYDATSLLYAPTVREDRTVEFRCGIRRQLSGRVSGSLKYKAEKQWSNVDIYDHVRHVWTTALNVSF